jgi:hypothetical protein
MTDTQTEPRPLSAYAVGSRWSNQDGDTMRLLQVNHGNDWPIIALCEASGLADSYLEATAATWTPLDPAPTQTDALREAAQRAIDAIASGVRWRIVEVAGELAAALAQPAPEPVASEPADGLQDLLAAAYQIVGVLAEHAGVFDHPSVRRALDALSAQQESPDAPLLPWPHVPLPTPEPPLTFRDRAELAALQGMLAGRDVADGEFLQGYIVAVNVRAYADALCAAREGGK